MAGCCAWSSIGVSTVSRVVVAKAPLQGHVVISPSRQERSAGRTADRHGVVRRKQNPLGSQPIDLHGGVDISVGCCGAVG